jgi:hypothetical protein
MKLLLAGVLLGSTILCGCSKHHSESSLGTRTEISEEQCSKMDGKLDADGRCVTQMSAEDCSQYGGKLSTQGRCEKPMSQSECSAIGGSLSSDGSCTRPAT